MRELPRAPGHKDTRWVHLLGPVPVPTEVAAALPGVDRDAVLADGAAERDARVVAGYDHVAAAYVEQLGEELMHKPFDRWVLEQVAGLARRRPVVDAGCGPGHVAAHLAELGADVSGVDLSPGMVAQARDRFPDIGFEVGDLTRLLRPPTAPGWGAVVAWYSLVHLAGSELPDAVGALARVLDDDGWLALAAPRRRRRCVGSRRCAARPSRWTSSCTTASRCWPRSAPPGWSTSSGTCAARTRRSRRAPSGSTSSPAGPTGTDPTWRGPHPRSRGSHAS